MTKHSGSYRSGDEKYINHLYRLVTGTVRSAAEYAWEWIDTWDGPASIWLVKDDTREPEDQLIAQYSLIPTPFSFWGKPYLAGKTENCMSHPDFRGKGMYFLHEQKYFEEAKKRFQLFFTTTGDVAKGAPGKVRVKLGYRPFDHWITLSYWLDKRDLSKELVTKLPLFMQKRSWLWRPFVALLTHFIASYTHIKGEGAEADIRLFTESEAPLQDIETLWHDNAERYGISVHRTADYLKWRINDNPYLTHYYLCYYEANILKGYIIYTIQDRIIYIIDILAENKNISIFKRLIERLKDESHKQHYSQIKCYTASKNKFLIDILRDSKLIDFKELFSIKKSDHNNRPTQIFVYVSDEVNTDQNLWENQHWYITDLIKEGRPYTSRLIG